MSVTLLLDSIFPLGLASLVVNIAMTIGNGSPIVVYEPVAWVTVTGMFASIIISLQGAIEELQAEKDNLYQSSYYNKCIDFQIDPLIINGVRMIIESLQGEFNTKRIYMIVYCTLTFPTLELFMCIGIAFLC